MGVDKATVEVGGIPLLQRAVELLHQVAGELIVVTRDQTGSVGDARIISDDVKDRGPLGGLLTGLHAAQHQSALVIPVDMPLLTVDLLGYLVTASAGWEITVARWANGVEPLVGVYATACTDALERFTTRPNPSAKDFVRSREFTVRFVDEFEVRYQPRFCSPKSTILKYSLRPIVRPSPTR
jgi:molybdopterin-guanine dinucleotide biosynthesis protein A